MNLGNYFDFVVVESDYLNNYLIKTITKIIESGFQQELSFGPLYEGRTYSGEDAEVTEEGDIIINSNRLKKYDEDVAMAIIAHELAHYHLKHFDDWETDGLVQEHEADSLAKDWGFDIDLFRKICGEPSIQKK